MATYIHGSNPVLASTLTLANVYISLVDTAEAVLANQMKDVSGDELFKLLGLPAIKTKTDYLTVTANTNLDTIRTKVNYITVTGNVNLDNINTRINELDAAVILKGSWNPTTASFPGAGIAQAGWSYVVTGDATVDGIEFKDGDRIICLTDNASVSVYSGNWYKADYTDRVNTVQGLTGAVTITDANLSTSDITTNNATTGKHGFLKKLSGNSTDYMAGDGNWTALPSGGGNTFADNVFYVYNSADNTKQIKYSIGGATTAKVVTIASAHTVDRTITLPDATTTLVGTDATQTLTNKTFGASTVTGAWIVSVAGAASTPAYIFTGAPFTAGTATTNKPLVLIETTGATSTAWNTAGTYFGINAYSSFTATGNLADLQYNGSSKFRVTGRGEVFIVTDQSRPISLNGSGASACNYYVTSSNTAGISGFQAENHRGSLNSYVHVYVGGNAVTGNIFGQNRQDRVCIIADGAQMAGMMIGTLTSDWLLFGTNNLEAMRIDANQDLQMAGKIVTLASAAGKAGLNIPSGSAPGTPVSGDIWFDGTDVKFRVGATTKTFTLT